MKNNRKNNWCLNLLQHLFQKWRLSVSDFRRAALKLGHFDIIVNVSDTDWRWQIAEHSITRKHSVLCSRVTRCSPTIQSAAPAANLPSPLLSWFASLTSCFMSCTHARMSHSQLRHTFILRPSLFSTLMNNIREQAAGPPRSSRKSSPLARIHPIR